MPPKRKGAAAKGAGGKRGKKTPAPQVEVEDNKVDARKDVVDALKKADQGRKHRAKVDEHFPFGGAMVVDDYDCMLNQTNIGHNNNKYYVIQVLQQGTQYYSWNRWGRVGESGANALKGPSGLDNAVKEFKKKFKDKTKNNWDDRASFKPAAGKYTLIEMDGDDDDVDEIEANVAAKLGDDVDAGSSKTTVLPCSLNKPTQDLIKLIFDNDMFAEAMKSLDIDVKKMPLGKLSKTQIAKGFEVLEQIEEILKKGSKAKLTELTSQFYTLIPHDFGRQRPPIISGEETLRKKFDMLMILGDIEIAQAMQQDKKKKKASDPADEPHPYDVNYEQLHCGLTLVDKKSQEYKTLDTYLKATRYGSSPEIKEVWKVNREDEDKRFDSHSKLTNRKLLWHGTSVAVVAAILKGGLRIMPHSGGRVGKGIYFASENSKSAGYVGCNGRTGIMFLNEVALGKEHIIEKDDWQLKAPPQGYDCIIAKGRTEPDPMHDTKLTIDDNEVVVPQGKPINQPAYSGSYFSQSEYLVYKESQNRIRYLLKMNF